MVVNEKIELLSHYEEYDTFSSEEIFMLTKLSFDSNSFIRGLVASLLVKNNSKKSLGILIRLANDKNSFVRTEAYDSLSVFADNCVITLLEEKIKCEIDNNALSYAILSFSEVCNTLNEIEYGKSVLTSAKVRMKSNCCKLSYHYGMYLLGEKSYLDEILSFLQNNDYRIVCSTISLLSEIVTSENIKIIKDTIYKMNVKTIAVENKINDFLKFKYEI